MQRISVLVLATLSAGILLGQSEIDSGYQALMKMIAISNQSLQRNITAKNSAAVMTDAQKLHDTFREVEDFWQKRNVSDAANFAMQAQTAAASIAKSAVAGNLDQSAADAKALGTICADCHMAHREKTEAGYKIK